jgi:hypothetical protein
MPAPRSSPTPRCCTSPQAPLLPGLLTALAYKLVAAEDPATVQGLLCVLAQLLRHDQQQLLDCLAGIQLRWGRRLQGPIRVRGWEGRAGVLLAYVI